MHWTMTLSVDVRWEYPSQVALLRANTRLEHSARMDADSPPSPGMHLLLNVSEN
jgi:hypothetical protein